MSQSKPTSAAEFLTGSVAQEWGCIFLTNFDKDWLVSVEGGLYIYLNCIFRNNISLMYLTNLWNFSNSNSKNFFFFFMR